MKIIGLTGGIGSGKTTVSRYFEGLNIPVFYADQEAREVYNDAAIVEQVKKILEVEHIHDAEGKLDRALIAGIIFNDASKRDQLNQVIHPGVKDRFTRWISQQKAVYCIREAAILIESGSYRDCDEIIVVTCPIEIRIQRVMERDHITREEVEKRMQSQMSDEDRITYARFVIENSGTPEDLKKQVIQIHHQLL